jgi:hypothetical protein
MRRCSSGGGERYSKPALVSETQVRGHVGGAGKAAKLLLELWASGPVTKELRRDTRTDRPPEAQVRGVDKAGSIVGNVGDDARAVALCGYNGVAGTPHLWCQRIKSVRVKPLVALELQLTISDAP